MRYKPIPSAPLCKLGVISDNKPELTNKEINKLNKEKELLEKKQFPLEVPTSFQNMAFTNPINGKAVFYGKSEKTIDEKITSVFLHRNKQYCWLFAEAYELFEDFIQTISRFYDCSTI